MSRTLTFTREGATCNVGINETRTAYQVTKGETVWMTREKLSEIIANLEAVGWVLQVPKGI